MELKTIIGEAEKMVKNKGGNKGYTTQKDTTTTNPPRENRKDLGNSYLTQHLHEISKGLLEYDIIEYFIHHHSLTSLSHQEEVPEPTACQSRIEQTWEIVPRPGI